MIARKSWPMIPFAICLSFAMAAPDRPPVETSPALRSEPKISPGAAQTLPPDQYVSSSYGFLMLTDEEAKATMPDMLREAMEAARSSGTEYTYTLPPSAPG